MPKDLEFTRTCQNVIGKNYCFAGKESYSRQLRFAMLGCMRTKGSAATLEAIRRLAVQSVLDGQTQAAVAKAFGVHAVTVAKWMARRRAEGEAGLVAKPTPGR